MDIQFYNIVKINIYKTNQYIIHLNKMIHFTNNIFQIHNPKHQEYYKYLKNYE